MAAPSPAGSPTLIDFFSVKKNRDLRTAKRALLLAIAELEKHQDVIKDLCAASIRIEGTAAQLSVSFGAPDYQPAPPYVSRSAASAIAEEPPLRPAAYEPPEADSTPWQRNQYSLGVAFHEALSRQLYSMYGASAVTTLPIEEFVPGFKGSYSIALKRLMAENPDKRFKNVREAISYVRGIGDGTVQRVLMRAVLVFLLLVWFAIIYFAWPAIAEFASKHAPATGSGTAANGTNAGGAANPPALPSGPTPEGMVRVTGGSVEIGGVKKKIKGFYFDKYPVKIASYQSWAKARAKALPLGDDSDYVRNFPERPVFNVSWRDAADYCSDDKGKRLPSEFEWKRAVDIAGYTPDNGQPNLDSGQLADAGATAGDKTSSGIFDLKGNLPEWMQEDFAPGSPMKVVRGGAYYLPASMAMERMAISPEPENGKGYLRVGFRCAHD